MLSPVTHLAVSRLQVVRDLMILCITIVVCAIPFLDQAFHMDDNFYMDMARNARITPMYPNDTPYNFHGRHVPDIASHSHPPLQTYFLALVQLSAGEGPGTEWAYHLSALVFPMLAAISMYFLSFRFVERPVWPSLVLAVTPVFMVMQHNLMTDLPMLAYWLAATATFLWATERRHGGLYSASALFLFAAIFTSYQAAALIPILGFYLLRRRPNPAGVSALLLPVVGISGWLILNYFHYGRFLLWDTAGYVHSRSALSAELLGVKVMGLLGYQGWLVVFPVFPLLVSARLLRGRLLALALLAAVYSSQLIVPGYDTVGKAIFSVGLVTGAFMVGWVVNLSRNVFAAGDSDHGFSRTDGQFLSLWYWSVVAYCLIIFTEGSARYILPLIPPLLLCFFRRLEREEASEYRMPKPRLLRSAFLASGTLVISLAWALALSHADREFAGLYRRAAGELEEVNPGLPSYYAGEWGFRYYLQRSGVSQLPRDESAVRGGSLVVLPKLALPYELPADLRSMLMPFHTINLETRSPLRILDRGSHAGFYSTGWGMLPFSISRQDLERLEIGQVNYMVERLPWAEVKSTSGVLPWPGYLVLEGKAPLAIVAKSGTKIVYDWQATSALLLELECGIAPDSYVVGEGDRFEFEIRQYNPMGLVLSEFRQALVPGLREEDRRWQLARLSLSSRLEGGHSLEFKFTATAGERASGAFAGAFLRRVH